MEENPQNQNSQEENKQNEKPQDWQTFFLDTLGFVSLTTDNLQKSFQQYLADKNVSLEEGKRIYNDFMNHSETKKTEFEAQVAKIFEKLLQNTPFALRSEVDELKKRIEELENKE